MKASELFSAVDRQSFPQSRRTLAALALRLAGRSEFGSLLAELHAGDSYARDAGLFLATVARDSAAVRAYLGDRDPLLQARAIKAWMPEATASDLVQLLGDAPAQTRAMVYNQLRVRRSRALADAVVDFVADRFGAVEAGRVLPACGSETVARLLPTIGATASWNAFAPNHAAQLLAEAERQLSALPESLRNAWWRQFGNGVFAAAVHRPSEVLDLLGRYAPAAELPYHPTGYARLARAYPERVVDLMTAPQRATRIGGFSLSRALTRALTAAGDDRLVRLGRRLRVHAEGKLAALLAALAPSRREAIYDAVYSDVDRSRALLPDEVLEVLPHVRRAAEARRMLALEDIRDRTMGIVHYTGFLPWADARERLIAALRSPLADERAWAYEALVRCARRSGDPEIVTEAIAILARLRNEQDPVRSRALDALAAVPGRLIEAAASPDLTTVVTDGLAARDASAATRSALQRVAVAVFQAHPTDGDLVAWALKTMEAVFGDDRIPYFGRLDEQLRRGQEASAWDAVRGWIESGTRRGKYSLLFSFTRSLGRRAYAVDGLQDALRKAIRSGAPSPTVRQAISLWLADPSARATRVEEVLRHDLSTIALSEVWSIVDGRRTDLLDLVLGRRAPAGPFLAKGVRWAPAYARHVRRWLPRHRAAYAELLTTIAKDAGTALNRRASAIHSLATIPDFGFAAVQRWVESPNIPLAEAALGALPWTDRPAEALPHLLAHTGDDRARVAVYAARRAARFVAPGALGDLLASQLSGSVKVTSRKELLRLAVDFGVPAAGDLLAADWSRADGHADVRAAIVSAARTHRELAPAWDILIEAAASDEYAVVLTLLMADPFSLPETDRVRYAALVTAACRSTDGRIVEYAWSKAPAWASWAADIDDTLLTALTDLDDRASWMRAAEALVLLVRSGSGSIVDPLFRRLVALDEADRGDDASQDRPALARVRHLAARLSAGAAAGDGSLDRAALVDAARFLSAYEPAASEAPGLRLAAIPFDAAVSDVLGALNDVGDLLADRPVAASDLVSDLRRLAERNAWGATEVRAIAVPLADRGDAAGGFFALALAERGRHVGWVEPFRGLVLRLRRHPVADVRARAYATSVVPT